jgi:hypothetical protein
MLFGICRIREGPGANDEEPDELVAEHIKSGVVGGRMWLLVEFRSGQLERKLTKKNLREAREEFKRMYDVIGMVRPCEVGKPIIELIPSRLRELPLSRVVDENLIFKDCRRCGLNRSSRELCRNASYEGGFDNICKACKREDRASGYVVKHG